MPIRFALNPLNLMPFLPPQVSSRALARDPMGLRDPGLRRDDTIIMITPLPLDAFAHFDPNAATRWLNIPIQTPQGGQHND